MLPRVGVIRTLSFGFTLKEKGPTGWAIDLTVPGLHKTSRCYGPAITPVSSLVVPSLEKLIDVRKGGEWDFVEEDDAPINRTSREYLFHTASHSTQCYDTSAWTKRVKVIKLTLTCFCSTLIKKPTSPSPYFTTNSLSLL